MFYTRVLLILFFATRFFIGSQLNAQVSFVSNCAPYPNYTVNVMAIPIAMTKTNNGGGCNINVTIAYTVTVNGTIPNGWCGGGSGGSMNNLHINFTCSSGSFDAHLPHVAGTGTVCACNNQGVTGVANCSTLTLNSYCANANINIQASGPGINTSTNLLNPLPIELIYFDASQAGDENIISWATASEFNNDHFTLLRSEDGNNWHELTEIKGTGNNLEKKEYSFHDLNPYPGINYYQLKQTDTDNSSKYSNIVAVDNSSNKSFSSTVYPNPATKDVTVDISTLDKGDVSIQVIDAMGQEVIHQTIDGSDYFRGSIQEHLELPAGNSILFIRVTQNNSSNTHRVCILND
ncbi:MAG: T9SS type A sorting domain-containing protein [Bacteroidetes bacterium]|nr:T9SS type A sorting domain-containing protein [Bacteroidota bacterium]